ARFDTEAKTLAALEHPAIVPVYDFGEQDGQPYLVMRYMPGGSLEDRLKSGTLPLVEAARIIARLAPALDEAHARGLVHRDLKPANILFDQRGNPYITDFGVVKITGVRMTDTNNRSIGTPAYMSPEQARGEADIDGRSDIFALGAVLFEMLTGQIPYDADTTAGQLVRRITDPVPNILQLRPDLPGGVQEIIARSLAKRRYVRFPTASDMARALEAVAQGKTPRETLVFEQTDENRAPGQSKTYPGRLTAAQVPSQVRPRLVKKPQPEKKSTQSRRLMWVLAGTAIVVLLVYAGALAAERYGQGLLGIGGLGGSPVETQPGVLAAAEFSTATATLVPVGRVVALQGEAYAQLPGAEAAPLAVGDSLPDAPDLRVWTGSGQLQLRLEDNTEIFIADDTELSLPSHAGEADSPHLVLLSRGSLLVRALRLLVQTDQPDFQAEADFAMMGVYYEPALGRFLVDCLEGQCQVGREPVQDIAGGRRAGFDRGAPLPAELAQYDYWAAIGGESVPTPTFTPTPTATLTPEPTFTPTPTSTATPTPEPTSTSAPVVYPTSPPVVYPTSPPVVNPTSPPSQPRPTNPPAPTSPPAATNDPNQG
ncbi:MAG: protein kinase domain-containing protein, partial [Anaerolineales bacterium]